MALPKRLLGLMIGLSLAGAGACSRGPNLDKVSPGTEVTLTRQDGGVVRGPVQRVEENSVVVRVGDRPKTVPRAEIGTLQIEQPGVPSKALPPAAKYREFVLPTGTTLSLRLMTAAGRETGRLEEAVSAELAEAIIIDGVEVLPAGTPVHGTVLRPSKATGVSSVGLRFDSIRAGSETYPIGITYNRTGIVPSGTVLKLMLDRDVEVKVSVKFDYL
jgi:hypothetical protein